MPGPRRSRRRDDSRDAPRGARRGVSRSARPDAQHRARPGAPRGSRPDAPRGSRPDAPRGARPGTTARAAAEPQAPSLERLRALFARSGLRLSETQAQQFWTFHQLLRERNDELDLTRLHSFDAVVLKHYVDCALVA